MKKKNFFEVIIEICDHEGFFKKNDLRKNFPEKSNNSLNQLIFYYKRKGLITKTGKRFKIIKKTKKPDMQKLLLTNKEYMFFRALYYIDEILPKDEKIKHRINEQDVLSLIRQKGCDEGVWNSLKNKLHNVGILHNWLKGGKKGDIFTVNENLLIDYLEEKNNLIKITPINEEVAERVKETISKYRDKNEEILHLETEISATRKEIADTKKTLKKLEGKLEKLETKHQYFPDLERIKSLLPVIEILKEAPEKELLIFFNEIFKE